MIPRLRYFFQRRLAEVLYAGRYLLYLLRLSWWKLLHRPHPLSSSKFLYLPLKSFKYLRGSCDSFCGSVIPSPIRNRLRRPVFLAALFILPTLLVLAVFLSRNPSPTEAGWFDPAWAHRQRLPISNTGTAQTDYQIMVTVDTATLITAEKLQSECQDIRFTNQSGNLLNYWIEPTTCNTATTKIWVKVPEIPGNSSGVTTDIYMYYGNPSSSNPSNSSTTSVFEADQEAATVAWPLTETSGSAASPTHPALSEGRDIVINGGFDTDTNWVKGTGWTIDDGVAHANIADSNSLRQDSVPIVQGKTYQFVYTISNYSSGSIQIRSGSNLVNGSLRSADGTYTETIVGGDSSRVAFWSVGGFVGDIDNVSVTQLNIPSSTSFTGTELLTNGDFSSWTDNAPDNWTEVAESPPNRIITQAGSGEDRNGTGLGSVVLYSDSSTQAQIRQDILSVGKHYHVSSYVSLFNNLGGGSVSLKGDSNLNENMVRITNVGQHSGIIYVPTSGFFRAQAATAEVTIDSVSATEVSPMTGSISGATPGTDPGDPRFTSAYSFDGSNDYVNIYSSDLNSAFNPDEGTLVAWAKVSDAGVWTDGQLRSIVYPRVDTNNRVFITKNVADNTLSFGYYANGVNRYISSTTLAGSTDWFNAVITWSKTKDEVKAYINGSQIDSTQTNLGDWIGNLATTGVAIGAQFTTGTYPWSGQIADVRLYSRALSDDEISTLYGTSTSGRRAYYTTNYPGRELIRKYSTAVTLGSPAAEETSRGPIAHWSFDEGQGIVAHNSADPEQGEGQITGATWATEDMCISGKCLSFDGTDDYVSANILYTPLNSFSLSLWVKPTSTLASKALMVKDQSIRLVTDASGNPACQIHNGTSWQTAATSSTPLILNQWQHIACAYDQTNIKVYINGTETGSSNVTTAVGDSANALRIGSDSSSTYNFFNGFIDEVKIYPYARTVEEVKSDYLRGATKAGSSVVLGATDTDYLNKGLVGYWKMDETSGTTVADSSGNGNHGTLTNAQETGTSDASGNSTTTLIDTDGTLSTTDDAYNGMILNFTAACGSIASGTQRIISDYVGSTKTFTVSSALAQSPDSCAYSILHQTGGKFGSGLNFDGVNDYWRSDSSSLVNPSSGTISLWVSTSGTQPISSPYILSHPLISGNNRIYIQTNASGTSLTGKLGVDSPSIGTKTITANTWNHVVLTWNGTNASFYVNGVDSTTTSTFGGLSSSTYLYLSTWNGSGQGFTGKVDETRIYNRALTAAEVSSLYLYAPGPVGHWKLDDNSGTSAIDSSGNGFTGTLTNSPTWIKGKIGSALNFTRASDDFVSIADNDKLDVGVDSIHTISFWFNPKDADTAYRLINKGNPWALGGVGYSVLYRGDIALDRFYIQQSDGTGDCTTAAAIVGDLSNAWSYMTIIINRITNATTIYKNGALMTTTNITCGGSFNNANVFQISSDTSTLTGSIDDVRIYNYARTQEQILEDMYGGRPIATVEAPLPKVTQSLGGSTEDADLSDGAGNPPIAEWKFDEKQGDTASDSSGNANHGTLTNSPTWASAGQCHSGACLKFGGTSYVSVPDSNNWDLAGKAATLELWFKTSNSSAIQLIDHFAGGTPGSGWNLYKDSNNNITFNGRSSTNNAQPTTSTNNYNDNQWHHVVVTLDGSSVVNLYIDGQFSKTDTYTNLIDYDQVLVIGALENGTGSFDGYIDDIKIYNYARTASQIAYDYNRGAPIAHYKMDECQGVVIHDSAAALSGASNNGTLNLGASGITNPGTCQTSGTAWGNGANGKYSSSMSFDGTDDYVWNDYNNNGTLDTDGGDDNPIFENHPSFTVSTWIKPTSVSGIRQIVSRYIDNSANRGWYIQGNGANLVFSNFTSTSNASITLSNAISINRWYHIVGVYTGSHLKMFIDGIEKNSTPLTGTMKNTTAPFVIGARDSSTYPFSGLIDDVRIYNYALSANQVKKLFNENSSIRFGP